MNKNANAFGAPGIEPRWTSSAKDGIINEIYFPHVDMPNTRDLQFLITDGESFCHEERRDLLHQTEYPEPHTLLYRLTNSDREGRYRLVKEIVVDPHSSVLLMHTRLEVLDPKLRGKLRLYALLAPHMKGTGKNNSARLCGVGAGNSSRRNARTLICRSVARRISRGAPSATSDSAMAGRI